MQLLLLMKSIMEPKPKAEHCRSAQGTWKFWKTAAWLHIAGTAGTRKTSQSSGKKVVMSQRLLHLWTASSQIHSLSPLIFHLCFPPNLLSTLCILFYHRCFYSMKSNLVIFRTLGILLTFPQILCTTLSIIQ